MVRTRYALILYFRMVAHKVACHTLYSVGGTLHRILRLKICSVVLLPSLSPACSSAIISSAWGLSLFKMTFSITARMTDEADSSVILAELQVALFRMCNNQRLSPWGRPFSCSPDPVTYLCHNIYHGLPTSLNKVCWYIINSGRLPLFQ